jgi:DNA-directed RNA polymerase specialized sigma24 family protein
VAASIEEMQRVLLAQCGDRAALESLLRGMAPTLRRYVASLVGPADADDVLQDSLVIVIRKLGGLDDPGAFRPWAYRIASREAFRCLKRRRLDLVRNEDDGLAR